MTGRNHRRSLRIARSLQNLRIVYRLLEGGMPPEPRVILISDAKLQRVWNRNIFSQEVVVAKYTIYLPKLVAK